MDIKSLLHLLIERDGSDLFLSVGANAGIKIEGLISLIKDTTFLPGQVKELAYSIMNQGQINAFEKELELDFSLQLDGFGRFRVNVFRERNEVAMVIRSIKETVPAIEELYLPKILKKLIMAPRGLILVVGPTGSGKSTSLASMIDYRNSQKTGHILTIEDPIEYLHSHKKSIINQREVGQDTHSYGSALRRAMREAPDVVLIGEIRDRETMQQALKFAQSGHLCLSTLHATNAAQTIKRIINFFPEPHYHQELLLDLSLNIKAIISQRLLIAKNNNRIPAVEVMLSSPYIRELIEKGDINKINKIIEQGSGLGMQTMESSLLNLYRENKVALQEVLFNSDSPHNLSLRIRSTDVENSNESNK